MNKFLELSSSPLMNLDHTKRYSGTKLVEEETLSQHITDTIMMGLKIIDEINYLAEYTVVNPSEYVMKAVYHDLEESITGDVPRPLKYYDEHTLTSMRNVADQIAQKFFSSQFRDMQPHYSYWEQSKYGYSGFILKIVDTLVVAHKVVKEVKLLNNNYMLRVAHEVSQYLHEIKNVNYFDDPIVDEYLSGVVCGAIYAMNDIIEEHQDCMRELNITGQSMI